MSHPYQPGQQPHEPAGEPFPPSVQPVPPGAQTEQSAAQPQHPGPQGGPPQPVTLQSARGFSSISIALIPLTVLLFFAGWAVASIALSLVKLPASGIVGAVVSAVFCAVMWWYKSKQFAGQQAGTTLQLDERGLRREDTVTISEIAWADLAGYTKGNTLAKAVTFGPTSTSTATVVGHQMVRAAGATPGSEKVSVMGAGTLQRKPGLSALWAKSVKENYGIVDDQVHSRDRLIVTPVDYEPDWRNGQIAQFLAYYRPDLGIPPTDDDVVAA